MMPDFARRGRDRSSRRASRRSFGACLSTSRRMRSTCRRFTVSSCCPCSPSDTLVRTSSSYLADSKQNRRGGVKSNVVSVEGDQSRRPAPRQKDVSLHRTLSATLAGTGSAAPRLPSLRRRSTTKMMKQSLLWAAQSRCWKSAGTRPGRLTLATWYQCTAPCVDLAPCRYRPREPERGRVDRAVCTDPGGRVRAGDASSA